MKLDDLDRLIEDMEMESPPGNSYVPSTTVREWVTLLREMRENAVGGGGLQLLEPKELADVLSENRGDLFVGGEVNGDEQVLVLYRGSFDRLAVPLTWFKRESDVEPDFDDFAILDYGQTIRFGSFEASSDAILYDFDPDYRAKLES